MTTDERPYTLVAELSYRCPLKCSYCSNPVDYAGHTDKLATEDWLRVFREAEALGVVQLNLTGGEPLVRDDLAALVRGAHALDLYVNLITSGIPLVRAALEELLQAGLSSFQLSIQDADPAESDRIAGRPSFEHKMEVARWVKELGLPLTVNFVLHRQNLARIDRMIALAERLGADRLELANTQYLGWALVNRTALLPARADLARAREIASSAKQRLRGKMEVLFVLPDYHSDYPKACMSGWGKRYIVVSPDGLALPCHLAHTLPGIEAESVQGRSLAEIWHESKAFQAFRGEAWMPAPCSTCERRTVDFGGCRCQAFHLTGDAAATDPACSLSPHHDRITAARAEAEGPLVPLTLKYRSAARSPSR